MLTNAKSGRVVEGRGLWFFGAGSLAIAGLGVGLMLAQQPSQQPQYADQTNDAQQLSDALDAADPPSQVARISVLTGTASIQPASVQDFSPAEANYPLTNGDRLYTDVAATAELQTGQLAVRLGQQTDMTVTGVSDTLAQFGLAQGSVHLRSYALDPNMTVELDTPNVAITVVQPGDARVDVDSNTNTTVVTVFSGQVEVDGTGLQEMVQAGESLRLGGSNPVNARMQRRPRADGLDRFSNDRDADYQGGVVGDNNFVNADTTGAADLAQYGDWDADGGPDADGGAVWYPRGIAADWQPYSVGHWVWISPWGWTWVESEPWGFAPFHYGRWVRVRGRWGWLPGPRVVRPVYSPALVVFVGGGRVGGVTAWFPLGPREPFVPWYHAGPHYVNRVNVSNIYNRDPVFVRRVYEQRTVVFNGYGGDAQRRNYANRQVATIAIPQDRFGSGRPVRESRVQVDPRQFGSAQVLQRPPMSDQRPVMRHDPVKFVPPARVNRPLVERHDDRRQVPPGSTQGGGPARGIGDRMQRPDDPRNGDPRNGGQPAPVNRTPQGQQPPVQGQPVQPGRGGVDQPNPRRGIDTAPSQPVQGQPQQPVRGGVDQPNPRRGVEPVQQPPVQAQPQQPVRGGVDQPNPRHGVEPVQQPPVQAQPQQPVRGGVDQPNPRRGMDRGPQQPVQTQPAPQQAVPAQPAPQPQPQQPNRDERRPVFNRPNPQPAPAPQQAQPQPQPAPQREAPRAAPAPQPNQAAPAPQRTFPQRTAPPPEKPKPEEKKPQ